MNLHSIEQSKPGAVPEDLKRAFSQQGYLAPVRLLGKAQCQLLMDLYKSGTMAGPMEWRKGLAASEPVIFEVARDEAIVDQVRQLIGDDLVLWGASFVHRPPGTAHNWHCDVESCQDGEGFVSVWIGLENTRSETGLTLVPGSHTIGHSVQEKQTREGLGRGEITNAKVQDWAREANVTSQLVTPDLQDGEAIIFDGRLWHGSDNATNTSRTALLLQYTKGEKSVYRPDEEREIWFRLLKEGPRPPVLAICGNVDRSANRIVDPPGFRSSSGLISWFTRSLNLPLPRDLKRGWKPHFLFDGQSRSLPHLTCHVSVLETGHSAHPPHVHIDEEILIVLDGQAEITIAACEDDPAPRLEILNPGDFVYHPAFKRHTITNKADGPVTYLMIKWAAGPLDVPEVMGSKVVRRSDHQTQQNGKPVKYHLVFEEPTAFLDKLHCHMTEVDPGGSYPSHADEYDVAIVHLDGIIKPGRKALQAPAMVYFGADTKHGMANPGAKPARYIVFELHRQKRHHIKPEPVDKRISRWADDVFRFLSGAIGRK